MKQVSNIGQIMWPVLEGKLKSNLKLPNICSFHDFLLKMWNLLNNVPIDYHSSDLYHCHFKNVEKFAIEDCLLLLN